MNSTITTLHVPSELAHLALRFGVQYNLQNNTWYIFGPVSPLLKRVLRSEEYGGYIYPKQLCECPVCGFNLNHVYDEFTGTHFYRCGDESCPGRVEVNEFFSFFTTNKKDMLTFEDDTTKSIFPVLCRTCKVHMPRTLFGARYWRVCTNSKICHEYVVDDEESLKAYASQDEDEYESSSSDYYIYSLDLKKVAAEPEAFALKTLRLDEIKQDLYTHSAKLEALYELLPNRIFFSGFVDKTRKSVLALLGLYIHEFDVEDTAAMFNMPIKFRNHECLLWQLTGLASGADALENRLIEECKILGKAYL